MVRPGLTRITARSTAETMGPKCESRLEYGSCYVLFCETVELNVARNQGKTCWMKTRLGSEVNTELRPNCDAAQPKAERAGWCWAHLDTATNVGVRGRSAGLRPGHSSGAGPGNVAEPEAGAPVVVVSGCARWSWTLFFSIAKRDEQVFDGPVRPFAAQGIGGGAVLPYAVAKCRRRIGLQLRLGQQSPQVSGQHITAAALRQQRVPGAVVKDRAFASADECLVAFERHPTVGVML